MRIFSASLGVLFLWCASAACSVGSSQESEDGQWPISIEHEGSRILLYQLQPESLSGDKLTGRAAVSIQRTKDAEPIFGAVWIEARIATDRDTRTVTLLDVKVPNVQFPVASAEERKELAALVQSELPGQHPAFSLDELIATLDPAVAAEPLATGLRNDPPKIIFVTKPTALVTIDGPPQMREIEGSKMMRVINTPFIILFDPAQKTYHLKAGSHWRRTAAIDKSWQDEPSPPPEVTSSLPKSQAGADLGSPSASVGDNVDVIVVTEPTELIVARGEPQWTPLSGNDLLVLANSENDVFQESATRMNYVLLGGRWYSSKSLENGDWSYVAADKLPEAFARIPADSPKAGVRVFIAGTTEAREAVLDASIPQTTAIKRSDAHCSVTYDGAPRFAPIAGTPMHYAVNTTSSVIEYDHNYYCCSDGVWYQSEQPTGPWKICTSVPDVIYTIPPSCPIYPVRYVYVYDYGPEYVDVGYLPGYSGCYVYGPTIVYGTGFWYPGWVGVAYYPYPWTYGFCAHYDPWYCGWNYGFAFAWGLSPWWFGHSCGWGHPGWWGACGFHGRTFAIQGSLVTRVSTSVSHNALAARSGSGRENIYLRDQERARPGPSARIASRGARASAAPNDLFVDREGHVMRQTHDGWEERQQGRWGRAAVQPTPPSTSGPPAGRLALDGSPERPLPPISPPGDRALPPGIPPALRPDTAPFSPRDSLRPVPSPGGDSFDRLREARERGNQRSSFFRQRPSRGDSRKG